MSFCITAGNTHIETYPLITFDCQLFTRTSNDCWAGAGFLGMIFCAVVTNVSSQLSSVQWLYLVLQQN